MIKKIPKISVNPKKRYDGLRGQKTVCKEEWMMRGVTFFQVFNRQTDRETERERMLQACWF